MKHESPEAALDAEELMHLALKAVDAQRNDEALLFLKRALALEPEDARLHYLIGAVHAEIGMAGRAITEIGRAVELDPAFGLAHFQLGRLLLGQGDLEAAVQAWRPLDELELDEGLRAFKNGLVHLVNDDYAACIDEVRRGLGLSERESLNEEMQRLLGEAEATLAAAVAPAGKEESATDSAEPAGRQHVLLAGYGQA